MNTRQLITVLFLSTKLAGICQSNSLIFTEVCVANIDQTMDYSNNYGSWVELYNPTGSPISLDDYYISNDVTNLTKHKLEGYGNLNPGSYTCLFFDHNAIDGEYGVYASKQIRFKLERNGGALYLSNNGIDVAFSIAYPASIPRCSYALTDINGTTWKYCGLPTPGQSNLGYYSNQLTDNPSVDCDSRLFTEDFTVHVSIPQGTTLRYTTDGSTPTQAHGTTSNDGIFSISQTTVLRLRLFSGESLPSGVVTRTYIKKDREYYLPIVAIATDPRNLYDDIIGCYVDGKNGILGRGSTVSSNLNMDWERPVNFEYLTAEGIMAINQETSFEVAGGYSRHFAPASFKVQAKKMYDGNGNFGYSPFAGKPHNRYKQLLVRNGGNNNRTDGGPRIKDAITQQTLTTSDYYIDAQDYQPVHVFINGKYLAMMNVREPNNRFHGCANYGYDNDEIDGFEYSGGIYHQKGGSRETFDKLITLSQNADTDNGYAQICQLLDIEEFVRYMAAICYTGNSDWLLNGNNVKGYRTWNDGKYHFVFFDQDQAWKQTNNVMAISDVNSNEVLTLYNNLKRNRLFRQQFITSYCILHGSIYTPERCKAIADSICNLVGKALTFDKRYTSTTYNRLQTEMWGLNYREERIQSLITAYSLNERNRNEVTIKTNNTFAQIEINGQSLPFNHYAGPIFGTVNLTITSTEGYEFVGWIDQNMNLVSSKPECTISKDGTYTAVYNLTFNESISPICINEISASNDTYVNEYGKSEDWIELYNRGQEPIDISEFYFSDDMSTSQKYKVNADNNTNTVIQPNQHLVVWCDKQPSKGQPHLPFKLKNIMNGYISIETPDKQLRDIMTYNIHSSKETVGRYPDGGDTFYTFYHPTIEKRNMRTIYDSICQQKTPTFISQTPYDDIISVSFYTLDGRKVTPQKGIYIRVVTYKNGRHESNKIIL